MISTGMEEIKILNKYEIAAWSLYFITPSKMFFNLFWYTIMVLKVFAKWTVIDNNNGLFSATSKIDDSNNMCPLLLIGKNSATPWMRPNKK